MRLLITQSINYLIGYMSYLFHKKHEFFLTHPKSHSGIVYATQFAPNWIGPNIFNQTHTFTKQIEVSCTILFLSINPHRRLKIPFCLCKTYSMSRAICLNPLFFVGVFFFLIPFVLHVLYHFWFFKRCNSNNFFFFNNVRLNLFNHLIGFIPCQICL